MSWYPSENETLIPPYTAIKMKKILVLSSVANYEVLVTQDNKYLNFDFENYASPFNNSINPYKTVSM